jgi:hypothetical protein
LNISFPLYHDCVVLRSISFFTPMWGRMPSCGRLPIGLPAATTIPTAQAKSATWNWQPPYRNYPQA